MVNMPHKKHKYKRIKESQYFKCMCGLYKNECLNTFYFRIEASEMIGKTSIEPEGCLTANEWIIKEIIE